MPYALITIGACTAISISPNHVNPVVGYQRKVNHLQGTVLLQKKTNNYLNEISCEAIMLTENSILCYSCYCILNCKPQQQQQQPDDVELSIFRATVQQVISTEVARGLKNFQSFLDKLALKQDTIKCTN